MESDVLSNDISTSDSSIMTGDSNINDLINSNSEEETLTTLSHAHATSHDPSNIKNTIKILGSEKYIKPRTTEKSIKKTFNQYMALLNQQEEERQKHKEQWLRYLRSDETSFPG